MNRRFLILLIFLLSLCIGSTDDSNPTSCIEQGMGCDYELLYWEEVGVCSASSWGISETEYARNPSLAINNHGNPVVAWQDSTTVSDQIFLRQWDDVWWEELGDSATGGGISDNADSSRIPSLAINNSGNPVVAWCNNRDCIFIKQWNGSSWEEVGEGSASGGGISGSGGGTLSLGINGSGNPVVAWQDDASGNDEIYIKQWEGSSWEEIGENSASGGGISDNSGDSEHPSLAINGSGNPVVAWYDDTSGNIEIYVKQWNGTDAWEEIGLNSASEGGISDNAKLSAYPSLVINKSGNPVVAWNDDTSGVREIYIRQWNGSNWEEIGANSATGGGISDNAKSSRIPSLAINNSGNPVVAWCNNRNYIYIKQWNGSSWEEVGEGSASGGGISGSGGGTLSLGINGSGNPVVAWTHEGWGDSVEIYIKQYVPEE